VEPAVIRLVEGDRFPVGELDGSRSERVAALAQTLTAAGFTSRVLTDIRAHLWVKAWGNLAFNPISALTGATLAEICQLPSTRELAAEMMREAGAVAERLGRRLRSSVEQRIEGAEKVGAHKTSMLQDVEAGRPRDRPLIGAFVELGRLTEHRCRPPRASTPSCRCSARLRKGDERAERANERPESGDR
jgi:2-dehydropantoate 2-reductase